MSGALLAIQGTQAPSPPSGTVLLLSSVAGSWSWVSTFSGNVYVEGWGGGGAGSVGISFAPFGSIQGAGGGGGGYFKIAVSVSVSTTLAGVVGAAGNPTGPSGGGETTYTAGTCIANGGGYAVLATAGAGGTASGGSTNISGTAGQVSGYGGGAGNGGGNQTTLGQPGTLPGGGASAGTSAASAKNGAPGQIKITVV